MYRIRDCFNRIIISLGVMLLLSNAQASEWQSPLLQDHPLVGKIFDLGMGDEVTKADLLDKLSAARFVLLGEKHDNPDHHALESELLAQLLGQDTKPAVIFEMLDDSQQTLLSGIKPGDSLDSMKAQLSWPSRSWDWQSYGPLFQLTINQGARIVAGNVNSDSLKDAYKQGDSVLMPIERFQSLSILDALERKQIQQLVYESHCELMPLDSLAPMVTVQMAKDASMAFAMTKDNPGKAILIAGGFHTSKSLAVPRHLGHLVPEASTAVVLLLEVSPDGLTLNDYPDAVEAEADFVWFSPKATDKDYCESLRNHKNIKVQ